MKKRNLVWGVIAALALGSVAYVKWDDWAPKRAVAQAPKQAQRAVLILPGQALSGQNRASADLINWFEGSNVNGVSPFEMRSTTLVANRTFNDRIAVLSGGHNWQLAGNAFRAVLADVMHDLAGSQNA